MKRTIVLLIGAVLIALYLSNGVMAFNSPLSPLADEPELWVSGGYDKIYGPWLGVWPVIPTRVPHIPIPTWTPTVAPPVATSCTVCYEQIDTPVAPILTPAATSFSVFVPVSPVVFHSPVATPRTICVAPGMSTGHVLCYGD